MNNLYYLNGADMYDNYGFCPSPGSSDDILSDFPFKNRYSHDWKDENGIETDIDAPPVLDNKTITLRGWIKATSLNDYSSKKAALTMALQTAGTMPLYHVPSNITHNVFCTQPVKVLSRPTPFSSDKIYVQIEIVFEAQHESTTGIPVVGDGTGTHVIIGAN